MNTIPKWHPLVVWPMGNGYRVRPARPEEYQDVRDGGIAFPTRQELVTYLDKHFNVDEIKKVTS